MVSIPFPLIAASSHRARSTPNVRGSPSEEPSVAPNSLRSSARQSSQFCFRRCCCCKRQYLLRRLQYAPARNKRHVRAEGQLHIVRPKFQHRCVQFVSWRVSRSEAGPRTQKRVVMNNHLFALHVADRQNLHERRPLLLCRFLMSSNSYE